MIEERKSHRVGRRRVVGDCRRGEYEVRNGRLGASDDERERDALFEVVTEMMSCASACGTRPSVFGPPERGGGEDAPLTSPVKAEKPRNGWLGSSMPSTAKHVVHSSHLACWIPSCARARQSQ